VTDKESKDIVVKAWGYIKPLGELGVVLFGITFLLEKVVQVLAVLVLP